MNQHDADCVAFGWIDVNPEGTVKHDITDSACTVSADEFQAAVASDNISCGGGYPWNKIWRTDRVLAAHGCLPSFQSDLSIYEDKLWVLHMAEGLHRITLLTEHLYRYRFSENGLTKNPEQLIPRLLAAYHAYDLILDYLEKHNRKAYIRAYNFYFTFCLRDLRMLKDESPRYRGQYRQTRRIFHALCRRIAPHTLWVPVRSKEFFLWLVLHVLPMKP